MERRSPPRQEPGHLHRRGRKGRDERGSSSQTYAWTGDWWGQDWGAWSWQDTHWWEHQDSAAAAAAANQPEMEAQQTDTVQDAVWQLDQMEISTDEEECSLETTTPTATGTMEGGVRIDPTDVFDVPLTMSDLPEDSSKAEKLSKMMTAALRHKPEDFQIELSAGWFREAGDAGTKCSVQKAGCHFSHAGSSGAQHQQEEIYIHHEEGGHPCGSHAWS